MRARRRDKSSKKLKNFRYSKLQRLVLAIVDFILYYSFISCAIIYIFSIQHFFCSHFSRVVSIVYYPLLFLLPLLHSSCRVLSIAVEIKKKENNKIVLYRPKCLVTS